MGKRGQNKTTSGTRSDPGTQTCKCNQRITCSTTQPKSADKEIENNNCVDEHLSLARGCENNYLCPLQEAVIHDS